MRPEQPATPEILDYKVPLDHPEVLDILDLLVEWVQQDPLVPLVLLDTLVGRVQLDTPVLQVPLDPRDQPE